MASLGRLPGVGDAVEHDGRLLTVTEIEGRRVNRVHVTAVPDLASPADVDEAAVSPAE